ADRAVPPAGASRRGRRPPGPRARFPGRVCRRRRGQGGADPLCRRCRLHRPKKPRRRQGVGRRCGQRPRGRNTEMKPWLAVVGIGEDGLSGLSAAARALVETAETLIGGERHLAMVPPGRAERLIWQRPLTDTIGAIAARRGSRVTVLASGDPLWYGVGAVLARHFPRDEMNILPQPGAFSLAAARLGWAIADCAVLSLHARPLDTLRLHLAPYRRLLLLSEDGATPRAVARLLTELGWGPIVLTVF